MDLMTSTHARGRRQGKIARLFASDKKLTHSSPYRWVR